MRASRMTRRFAAPAVVLVAALALILAAGCGMIAEKWTVIEWYADYFEKYYPMWFEQFEKDHADQNVRIRFRAMVGNAEQMTYTMLISHTLSDCMAISTGTSALLLENPVLEPLTPQDVDIDDLPVLAIKLASDTEGNLVGYPYSLNVRPFLYFNREALRQGGTSASEIPETYDAFRKWASRLFKWQVGSDTVFGPLPKGKENEAVMLRRPIGMIRGFTWQAIPILISYMDPVADENGESDGSVDDYLGGPPSGKPFRFNTPEFIKGLAEYRDFYLPKKTAVADGDVTRLPAFIAGGYAGVEASNWIYGEVLTVDMQVSDMPHAENRDRKVWMSSTSIGVSRESKHLDLAKEFAAFITRPEAQIDAYYGHGYLPASFTAYKMLAANDTADLKIRSTLLADAVSEGEFVGVPLIRRQSHDSMDIYLYIADTKDRTILEAACPAGARTAEVTRTVNELAQPYVDLAERLAVAAAAETGADVKVFVQGTPPEMIPSRSYVTPSPVKVYMRVLSSGVFIPIGKDWNRLQNEVITRVCQFVTRGDDPMDVAEAGAWAQKEAEDIMAGLK